jgi:hypothetical protein
MADEQDVHFTQKQVDESWKEAIAHEKSASVDEESRPPLTFAAFTSSLGLQALIHLGELKAPGAEKAAVDWDAARETIDLLLVLKEKTKGNLSHEENELLLSLIADLQFKYVQRLEQAR